MGDKEQVTAKAAHNMILENRKALFLSGVKDIRSFDDESVVLKTEMGDLSVKGSKLHIISLDKESGEFKLEGEIRELVYSNKDIDKKSLLEKLLR